MDVLPRDVFPYLLTSLSAENIRSFCLTHKRAYGDVCNNSNFWRVLIMNRWGNVQTKSGTLQDYISEYRRRWQQDSLLLFDAIDNNDIDYLIGLLDKGFDVNVKDDITKQTPLYRAVEKGNSDIVKLLLEGDADPNIPAKEGRTPLFVSVAQQDYPITYQLLIISRNHSCI